MSCSLSVFRAGNVGGLFQQLKRRRLMTRNLETPELFLLGTFYLIIPVISLYRYDIRDYGTQICRVE